MAWVFFLARISAVFKKILCSIKWFEQWFDPCWVDQRLVPYHARLEWSHLSNQHRVRGCCPVRNNFLREIVYIRGFISFTVICPLDNKINQLVWFLRQSALSLISLSVGQTALDYLKPISEIDSKSHSKVRASPYLVFFRE